MLSGVLKSDIAIAANIAIMRAFVQVRKALLAASTMSAELGKKRRTSTYIKTTLFPAKNRSSKSEVRSFKKHVAVPSVHA